MLVSNIQGLALARTEFKLPYDGPIIYASQIIYTSLAIDIVDGRGLNNETRR